MTLLPICTLNLNNQEDMKMENVYSCVVVRHWLYKSEFHAYVFEHDQMMIYRADTTCDPGCPRVINCEGKECDPL